MPTSHTGQINTVVDLITSINPKSILDIGIGHGKYGFLAREYLDVARDTATYRHHKIRIDGIEGFPQYITDLQRHIYDNIYIGNALEVIDKLDEHYDLIMMIDVFEHFTKKEGDMILEKCLKKGRHVLISCPKDMDQQGPEYGNVYETHKFQWKKEHFAKHNKVFISNYYSLICLFGPEASEIKKKWRSSTLKIKLAAMFPTMRRLYLSFKGDKR